MMRIWLALSGSWHHCATRLMASLIRLRVQTVPPHRHLVIGLLCVSLVTLFASIALAQNGDNPALTQAKRATVFLMQTYTAGGAQAISCVGSGTVISSSGLILTNAHLASATGPCRGERIVVSLPLRLDEPPVPTYVADVVQADLRFDVAVLQITGGLDGSVLEAEELNLPFVPIGDPSSLLPGSSLTVVGYPDPGDTSVASADVPIIGTTIEKSGSTLAWFRIGAEWGGTGSGGGAYDPTGRLVGVPTSAPSTAGRVPGPNCLSLQDNTHDGSITEQDACVPVGAPITQVRPISFATPLVEAARNGFRLSHKAGINATPPVEDAGFGRLFFATGVSETGVPTHIITSAPAGTTSLFLFFDYRNMRPGTPYELKVTRNGVEERQLSLGPLAWGGGQHGMWYIGTQNVPWPDGSYEFVLLVEGEPLTNSSIVIGGSPAEPSFSNLAFGVPDASGGFATPGTLLPSEVTQIDARFDFQGMTDGQQWTEIWYLDGAIVSNTTRKWERGAAGQALVSALNYDGLPLGTYRLELLIADRLAATGDIYLAGRAGPDGVPKAFSNARIASSISADGLPEGQTGSVMPLGTNILFVFVDWDLIPTGTLWTYRWFLDGRLVASSTQRWDGGGVGSNLWMSLSSNQRLPQGSYAVEVILENRPMFSHSVAIGSGTQPQTGQEATTDEVFISGIVRDALTGTGISNASVIVLDWRLESARFTWDQSEIHTQAITDEQGRFYFPRGLPRAHYYTVYVFADGYLTIVEDTFTILSTQSSPVDIVIEMARP